jgi:hypothetical protein
MGRVGATWECSCSTGVTMGLELMPLPDIAWSTVATGVASFAAGVVVKTLLDLRLGVTMVKYLWWLRPRRVFGENPYGLAGRWEHIWASGGSKAFAKEIDRHGHPQIWQFGVYCYAEFVSKGRTYAFFGRIAGQYFVGEWFDLKDRSGYYGTFELRIVNSDKMEGMWIGHSQEEARIRVGRSSWRRVPS